MAYSPPGSSVHGISQERILEWVAVSFSRDVPDPGIEPTSPALAGRFFTTESPGGEAPSQDWPLLGQLSLTSSPICTHTTHTHWPSSLVRDTRVFALANPSAWISILLSSSRQPQGVPLLPLDINSDIPFSVMPSLVILSKISILPPMFPIPLPCFIFLLSKYHYLAYCLFYLFVLSIVWLSH